MKKLSEQTSITNIIVGRLVVVGWWIPSDVAGQRGGERFDVRPWMQALVLQIGCGELANRWRSTDRDRWIVESSKGLVFSWRRETARGVTSSSSRNFTIDGSIVGLWSFRSSAWTEAAKLILWGRDRERRRGNYSYHGLIVGHLENGSNIWLYIDYVV